MAVGAAFGFEAIRERVGSQQYLLAACCAVLAGSTLWSSVLDEIEQTFMVSHQDQEVA